MPLFGKAKKTQENAAEKKPNGREAAKEAKKKKPVGKHDGRIALFGCRAAGKTVYIGSLFHEYHGRASGLDVTFLGDRSAVYLADLQKSILASPRTWPAPTVVENEVRLKLELESALATSSPKVNLQLFDPPGEWLALGGDEQAAPDKQGGAKAMRDFVAEADGIFFFFEPDNFAFKVLRGKIKKALPELQKWEQDVDERLGLLVTALKENADNLLVPLQSENFLVPLVEKDDQEEMVREVDGILSGAEANRDSLLKGLFRDAELKYLLRKHELNVEPILANAQEISQTRTPTGKAVDVLFRIIELIQESAASEDKESETKLLQNIESYFRIESNNRLMAAVTRLQEISKKAEEDSTAENRSIAVIIAKADELDVFRQSPDRPYVLIPPHLEHLKFKQGPDRLDNLRDALKSYWEKQDTRWGSIIDQLLTGPFKSLFLKLMSFPGDFQIFFVSAVGEAKRDKNGFMQPPQGEDAFKPAGVDKPVLWTAQQIYSHAMIYRAIRRMLRWAILPIVLLLIPAALFTYNALFQSALERETDPTLQTAATQSYKWLVSLPMPPKAAVTTRIAFLDFNQKWAAYQQQVGDLFSRPDKRPDEALEQALAQLELLIQGSTGLVHTVAQHQDSLRTDAARLENTLRQPERLRLHILYANFMLNWLRDHFDSSWAVDDSALEAHLKTLRASVDKLRYQLKATPKEVSLWPTLEQAIAQLQLQEIVFRLTPIRSQLAELDKQYRRSQGWFLPEWSADEPTAPKNIEALLQQEKAVKHLHNKLATIKALFSEVKPNLQRVSALKERLVKLQQSQAQTQKQVEQLAASIQVEYTHLLAWQKYKELQNRLEELNLTGSQNEIASLLTQAEEVYKLAAGKIVSGNVMKIAQGKARALQKMQQAISSAIVALKNYQQNGVPMKFSFTNPLAITLSVPLADGREQTLPKGQSFRWLPTLPLPMVLIANASDIELPVAPLMVPGDFKKDILIKVTGQNQTLILLDTWMSYAEALESVLVPYDGAWIH
ncbi:MAG: hypothetical protein DRR08_03155 [Candidatus Parabeggiatoa sp. nov. 2]|nr:MAG: hypothetical protein B6247_19835 [Beggiatoa sp. 4572_84]RKZ63521.1 MAG: hypothetical protein DRR08_03155 [Gammaproteobacteria bacterium]